ncbi:MAG: c-type cytochrome biogenesis protein CcmI [Candidatus Rokubacteria bacterium]|nr:c-type cytochrome biogenesis protein CcmI [Candidatus Rokubacteria bacterium]
MTGLLAIAVLAALALLLVLYPLLRRPAESAQRERDDDLARDLLEEKITLYRAIKELEWDRQAGHLIEPDYAELRARYEARAAAVLKRLDELGVAAPPPAPEPRREPVAVSTPVPWSRRPAALVLGGLALVGFGLALGVLIVRFTQPDPMAGTPMPGSRPLAGMPMPGIPQAPTEGSPRPIPVEMLEGMLSAAHTSLDEGRYQEAIAAYKAVLARDPQNANAITHLGVILAIAGHADAALEAFDKALAIDPDYAHALWDKAKLLAEQKQDPEGAVAVWERFVKVVPPGQDRDRALALIKEAKARLPSPKAAKP